MEFPLNNQSQKKDENTSISSSKSDGKRPDSSSIQIPSITLPKGGGALKNIDEKFLVNAANGTAAFSVPLPFSKTRSDFAPALTLSYNSGSGNGIFGLGWNCDVGFIQRKTDKQLPRYEDAEESDVFLFSGAEDLVPALKKDNLGNWINDEYTAASGEFVKRYKPRVEIGLMRIERITPVNSKVFFWRVTSPNNIVTIFGRSASAQITNPIEATKIFKWLPELCFDDRGNCFEYEYAQDNFSNVKKLLYEQNRLNGFSPCINSYLKNIKYGNTNPYSRDELTTYNPPAPINAGYMFETVFDFYDHDENNQTPIADKDWLCRLEPFSDFHAGFEIRTYRLCRRILFFHYFKELNDDINPAPCLVRSLDFTYRLFQNTAASVDEIRNAEADYIISIQQSGYIKNGSSSYSKKSLPPVEFTYQELSWSKTVEEISPENIVNAPVGLGTNYQWVDLWSEGISGILTEQASAWYYKSNLGNGNFSGAQPVIPKPSFNGISNGLLQLLDLEADGRKFIVSSQGPVKGYFEISDDNEWQPFMSFDQMPNINFNDSNLKFIDLNGDGRFDLIMSEENIFLWYPSDGLGGYDSPEVAAKPFDEEKGAALVFADTSQSIYLTDMSGDGMTDIVRIRNGEVCYWPNMGYGQFGAKVNMENAPLFDLPDSFNVSYLHLADVSGTGATDILYLGKNQFSAWLNLSGNSWSEPVSIDPFPSTELPNQLSVVDLLGNGTACIVWSSSLPQYANNPMKYIDLMGGMKPYIMRGYINNFGKEVSWEYKSSTFFYLEDKQAGTPWITKLPFPVQCVAKVNTKDLVAGTNFTNSYSYHHGYYDHTEREYRGFGRVEQTDTEDFSNFILSGASNVVEEDLHQPPVKTITWIHTGAYLNDQNILYQFANEYNKGPFEFDLPKSPLPNDLSAEEIREALRACKGIVLRQEVYSADGSTNDDKPYSTGTHNCIIKLLQPHLENRNAVFISHESEALDIHYERNFNDPRIAHSINLEVDDFGNVLQAASVVYGRKTTDAALPAAIQTEQSNVHVIYTTNDYTNNFDIADTYRLKSLAETKTFELTNNTYNAVSSFTINNLLTDFAAAPIIQYQAKPNGSLQKRLIGDVQAIFLNNDLKTPLPLSQLDTLGLTYQTFKLAFTPSLVTNLYGTRVSDQMLIDAKYVQQDGVNWWVSSGTNIYLQGAETIADAQKRFYFPVAVRDPFKSETKLFYDDYHLLLVKTEDALQNIGSAETIDYRTLQATTLKDLNNNISEIITDELGLVIATSVYGDEGDGNHGDQPLSNYNLIAPMTLADVITDPHKFLQQATGFFYYDLFAWLNRDQPVCYANVARETHESELSGGDQTKVFLSVGYSNGLGQNLQTKVQAEPGNAFRWNTITNTLETIDTTPNLRWVGNGRTVLNNKGNPVKQYDPFFSITYEYEDEISLVEIGFSSVLYYDAPGRNIRIEHANGTISRIEFDTWKQLMYDENDTVLESQWYVDRGSPNPTAPEPTGPEQRAAWLAAKHANTPAQVHLDSLGRSIYTIADNATNGLYATRVVLDIENNQLQAIDARNNIVMQYDYDMISRQAHQVSMDAGERFTFCDALNKPVYTWDSRNHRFHSEYDILHRPTNQWLAEDVTKNLDEKLIALIVYGENKTLNGKTDTELNFRGKPFQAYDQSGLIQTSEYDFKGNVKSSNKQITKDYKNKIDWTVISTVQLENEMYESSTEYDAFNRPTKMITPHATTMKSSEFYPSYNEAKRLKKVEVSIREDENRTVFVSNINYNEKAQRTEIYYGNNTKTAYKYEKETFRLKQILSTRNAGNEVLQDLNYSYDPVGNITQIVDHAQPDIFFDGQQVKALNEYEYDALYRLVTATGREHAGQTNIDNNIRTDFNYRNFPFANSNTVNPNDAKAFRNYTERYEYDKAGNMLQQQHISKNSWTRTFEYNNPNNQLTKTEVGTFNFNYTSDAHGNMTLMEHLQQMIWNFKDELSEVDLGGGGHAYYVYDAGGNRVRKVIERLGGKKQERLYLGAVEIYREYNNAGDVSLDRESLHVLDDKKRIALIETKTIDTNLTPSTLNHQPLLRYQYDNHLGSASLELDEVAQIISYEEYFPYGTTSYSIVDATSEVPAKRYRYTGKERDEETGLNYHGARYYAMWLARWIKADPLGIKDGINVYSFVHSNPIHLIDPNGKQAHKLSYEERMANTSGIELLTNNTDAGIDMTGIGEAPAALPTGTTEVPITIVTEKPKYSKKQYKDPEVSDPEVMRQYEGRGKLELADVTQFGKGMWNGPAGWVHLPQFQVDPYHKAAEWMGNEFGKNLTIEVVTAGVGAVVKWAAPHVELYFVSRGLNAGERIGGEATQWGVRTIGEGVSNSAKPGARIVGQAADAGLTGGGKALWKMTDAEAEAYFQRKFGAEWEKAKTIGDYPDAKGFGTRGYMSPEQLREAGVTEEMLKIGGIKAKPNPYGRTGIDPLGPTVPSVDPLGETVPNVDPLAPTVPHK